MVFFYYQRQRAVIKSIQYGQLMFQDYFQDKRYDISHQTIKKLYENKAIYLAKRPINNKVFGRSVSFQRMLKVSHNLIYGMKENLSGEEFLKVQYSETNLEAAFELFQRSANFSYPEGQVNLAQMYLNGQYVEKDLKQTLYWLKAASLNKYKPAIYKYGIVCKQVDWCNIGDFYQELTENGIEITVRKVNVKLDK